MPYTSKHQRWGSEEWSGEPLKRSFCEGAEGSGKWISSCSHLFPLEWRIGRQSKVHREVVRTAPSLRRSCLHPSLPDPDDPMGPPSSDLGVFSSIVIGVLCGERGK